jgi:NTE family protein
MAGAAVSVEHDDELDGPQSGIGLALSGGGYRAMLFHVGSLLRLNEVGLLKKLDHVSSVSGGSITAGVLGLNWTKLDFQTVRAETDKFDEIVTAKNLSQLLVDPIRSIASESLDGWAVGLGLLTPGKSVADGVANRYDKLLFKGATLQNLPDDGEGPRFVINATSVQSGALVRFSRRFMADYLVGMIPDPKVPLCRVVAASSAFPPVLSPIVIDVNPSDFTRDPKYPQPSHPFNESWVLADGGVYDNLGLETLKRCQTILVSDGGAKIAPEGSPAFNWAEHSMRILDIIDNQVRSLRKRALIKGFKARPGSGTFWSIRTDIDNYGLSDALIKASHDKTLALSETPTRLKALPTSRQNQLMNWGYAVCDAALRRHTPEPWPKDIKAPAGFPFPDGIG